MKKQLTFLFFLFNTFFVFGQSEITVLNGYKYIYLPPLTYQDGSTDRFGIRSQVKEKLIRSGFNILESTTPPQGVNVCLVVTCFIEHTNNWGQPIPDYVYLKIFNCENQVVYSSQGASGTIVMSIEQGWRKATKSATSDFDKYRYTYDESKSIARKIENSLPTLELTGLKEDSIRSYLTSKKIDPIEGIYKSYSSGDMPYYKFGIIKVGDIFKAVIIESEFTYWKQGEVKAIFEKSSMKGLYSTKWYKGDKKPYETFASMDNEAFLTIELINSKSEKTQDKFIKLFPTAK
jgi:hypothetical protein